MTDKSGTCHSAGNMKDKTVIEITKTLEKTVNPQTGVQLGAAIEDNYNVPDKPDNDYNVPDKPDKTMDIDVMETNNDDILDDKDEKEDTEDSDTYSRNKKMCLCNNKSTSTKSIHNMQGEIGKNDLKDNGKSQKKSDDILSQKKPGWMICSTWYCLRQGR